MTRADIAPLADKPPEIFDRFVVAESAHCDLIGGRDRRHLSDLERLVLADVHGGVPTHACALVLRHAQRQSAADAERLIPADVDALILAGAEALVAAPRRWPRSIDDATGKVTSRRLLPPMAGDRVPHVTEFVATEIAQRTAAERGWPWEEPVIAIHRRRGLFWGPRYWEVLSNTNYVGRNVSVAIAYTTGQVLGSGLMPR
jgi:hypothetical protein